MYLETKETKENEKQYALNKIENERTKKKHPNHRLRNGFFREC